MTTPKPPAPGLLRWTVLILISVALFGNYYAYDSIGPVADSLQRLLHFSDTQIGTLNAIYSFPNIVMVLVGGIIVDRIGCKLATVIFAATCLLGAILTAMSPSFTMMALGRLVFGLGAESMIVAITVAIGQWFVGRSLGFAFGINLAIARAGSVAADYSPGWAKTAYAAGWQEPLWLAAIMAASALVASLAYYLLERWGEQRYDLTAPAPSDRIVWSDLLKFDRSFWLVVGLCVTFYAVVLPFRSTFSIKYFQHAFDLTLNQAGDMNGHVFVAAMITTPIFGWMVDKVGHRALFMTLGCLLLFLSFPILAYTHQSLWVSTVLIGIAFSLVPAVLWPSVPYLVEAKRLGTAYGLMTMLQNIGMMICNLAAGYLNDRAGAGAANPRGYLPMLWMFGGLTLFGFLFAALLRLREQGPDGHDLERPTPRALEA